LMQSRLTSISLLVVSFSDWFSIIHSPFLRPSTLLRLYREEVS
jgi:hypothetical protein